MYAIVSSTAIPCMDADRTSMNGEGCMAQLSSADSEAEAEPTDGSKELIETSKDNSKEEESIEGVNNLSIFLASNDFWEETRQMGIPVRIGFALNNTLCKRI